MMQDPVIKFKGYSIQQLDYKKVDSGEVKPSSKLNLSCGISDDLKFGKIILTVDFKNTDVHIVLTVEGLFDVNGVETKELIEEFLTVNGTAIVYPYVRSIISMVSSLDSNNVVILPTINTTNFIN